MTAPRNWHAVEVSATPKGIRVACICGYAYTVETIGADPHCPRWFMKALTPSDDNRPQTTGAE